MVLVIFYSYTYFLNSLARNLISEWSLVHTYIYILRIVKLVTYAILDKIRPFSKNTGKVQIEFML